MRSRQFQANRRESVLKKYERICFDKSEIDIYGRVKADFVCPGHPLLDAAVDYLLQRDFDVLKKGAVLVDETDNTGDIRVLVYLLDESMDAHLDRSGNRRVISRHVHFIEMNERGEMRNAGYAPYLNYTPVSKEQMQSISPILNAQWLRQPLEPSILEYAVEHILPMLRDYSGSLT